MSLFPSIEPFRSAMGLPLYKTSKRRGVPPWLLVPSYDKEYHPHQFQSIDELCRMLGITLKSGHWRLTEYWPCHSSILPSVIGWLVATNGILALVLRGDGEKWWECHLDHLVIDKEELEEPPRRESGESKKAKMIEALLSKYD